MSNQAAPAPKRIINVHEAKTHFSKLLAEVAAGEEVIIARAGKPVARLAPLVEEKRKIKLGVLKDANIWIADDFDAPLPDDVLALFEGR